MTPYKFIETYSQFVLNETLKTHDIDLTIDKVGTELSLLRFNFDIKKHENTIKVTLNGFRYVQNVYSYLDVLNSLLIDRFGWFPSKMYLVNFSGMDSTLSYDYDYLVDNVSYLNSVTITFESKFDRSDKFSGYLYHLTINNHIDSILKKGIVPKSKNKISKHLDRIYVCKTEEDCKSLINKMSSIHSAKNRKSTIDSTPVILKFKVNGINLYKDPNFGGKGYYVIDNIPPNVIEILK